MKPEKICLTVMFITALLLSNLPWSGIASGTILAASEAEDGGKILYVKPVSAGDCSSWAMACELKAALTSATAGDEIWVVAGIHYPGTAGDWLATFQLKDGVAVYGGFAGIEIARSERDWLLNITVLSGDIDRNYLLDGGNAYHVVTCSEVSATSILDGFTISGGNAVGDTHMSGGGMYCANSSPTLANLTFSSNKAAHNGGGMYNYLSSPKLTNISFSTNSAERGGGLYDYLSSLTLTKVTFSANLAENGGGMYNYAARDLRLVDIAFLGNQASANGGGMFNIHSPLTLNKAVLFGNTAETGGGMYNYYGSSTINNVTLSSNNATTGGGMYNLYSVSTQANVTYHTNSSETGGGIYNTNGGITLKNAIVWGNTPLNSQLAGDYLSYTYTYSDIQVGVGYEGEGNIIANPLLGELSDNGGYTVTHALLEGSPAIDVGDPLSCSFTDQRGMPRPADGNRDGQAGCDMGAYEVQPTHFQVKLPLVTK
jgi:predicted outer membrane repeat protein